MFYSSGPEMLVDDEEESSTNIRDKIKDHICCFLCCLAIIITFCIGIGGMLSAILDYFIKN